MEIVIIILSFRIINSSFFEKGDLEQWLKPQIFLNDYGQIIEDIWDFRIEKGLSFMVKDSSDRCVGVAFNFDANDNIKINICSRLLPVYKLLDYLEESIM